MNPNILIIISFRPYNILIFMIWTIIFNRYFFRILFVLKLLMLLYFDFIVFLRRCIWLLIEITHIFPILFFCWVTIFRSIILFQECVALLILYLLVLLILFICLMIYLDLFQTNRSLLIRLTILWNLFIVLNSVSMTFDKHALRLDFLDCIF